MTCSHLADAFTQSDLHLRLRTILNVGLCLSFLSFVGTAHYRKDQTDHAAAGRQEPDRAAGAGQGEQAKLLKVPDGASGRTPAHEIRPCFCSATEYRGQRP